MNRAGNAVREDTANFEDYLVIEEWRAAHRAVLNTFQAILRTRTRDSDITVAQRHKRRSTIFDKLSRFPEMQLARMDDVAGCRLIFKDIKSLANFRANVHKARFHHKRKNIKLADLVGALAEAKLELAEVQDLIVQKDKEMAELKEAFEAKGSLKRQNDAYYETDGDGNPIGVAFCLRCWEREHKKRQLVRDADEHRINVCTNCGQRYDTLTSSKMRPSKECINEPIATPSDK